MGACRELIAGSDIQLEGDGKMKTTNRNAEQAKANVELMLKGGQVEHRQTASENEEGGYATIDEIREGLFGFMPAILRLRRFPGSAAGDGERQA